MIDASCYQSLLNLHPDGLLILNQDGTVLESNAKAKELLGFEPEGRSLQEAIGKESLQEGPVKIGSKRLLLQSFSFRCPKEEGSNLQLVILRPDSSHKVERERARLERILDSLQEAIVVQDSSGNYYYVNAALAKMMGLSKEKLLQEGWRAISTGIEEHIPIMQRIEQGVSEYEEVEHTLTLSDGRRKTFRVVYTPILYRRQNRVLSSVVDITDLKNAQERLEVQKEQLGTLLEILQEGVIIADSDGGIHYVNDAYCQLAGRDKEELFEHGWKVVVAPEDLEKILEVDRKIEQGAILVDTGFMTYKRPDGELRHAQRVAKPIIWEGKRRVLVSLVDITEIKEAQERLQEVVEASSNHPRALNPIIPIWTKVLMAPLLGSFDSMRMQDLSERLLEAAARQKPKSVLLDLSGIAQVDTQVVSEVVRLIGSLRFLGTTTLLSGIGPVVAQSLVRIGATLDGIPTYATLEQALRNVVGEVGHARR